MKAITCASLVPILRQTSDPLGRGHQFDQPGCEGVRRYFAENALYWVREYHMDGLRLDAVQTIKDDSARHILAENQSRCRGAGCRTWPPGLCHC